ncbi:hypothetical protein HYFRA_00013374 [Hymenoscyphus fraxineus]|uniref:Uncharacterized protein n=1 Tax=Hymenoscyphus fraxineus TaxID=746836 RepID=A0A9N9L5P3_9HELO|nr:hypothetical protein HYFRA_00013374 [Hymenoscyphus fraxineus]
MLFKLFKSFLSYHNLLFTRRMLKEYRTHKMINIIPHLLPTPPFSEIAICKANTEDKTNTTLPEGPEISLSSQVRVLAYMNSVQLGDKKGFSEVINAFADDKPQCLFCYKELQKVREKLQESRQPGRSTFSSPHKQKMEMGDWKQRLGPGQSRSWSCSW